MNLTNVSSSISFSYLNSTVMQAYNGREQELRTSVLALQAKGSDVSNVDLLDLQSKVQQWTLITQLVSTITQEVGNAMKGIVQKSGS
jgi:hypothetical protein